MPQVRERASPIGDHAPQHPPSLTDWWSRAFALHSPLARSRWAQIVPTVVAVLAYLGSLSNGFAYDDIAIIRDNDWVRHGAVLTRALSLPYWPKGLLYRPFTSFSYGVDWLVGGGDPRLFHAINLVWYAIGTALLVRLALRWWSPLAAATAGLLFAIQPLHVEAVANVVGRAELLAGAAFLGMALVISAPGSLSTARVVTVGLLAAAALAAKETGVVAPLVAWATVRMRSDATAASTRRVTIAALLGIALVLGQRLVVLGTLAGDVPHPAFVVATTPQALALALATVPRALSLLALPQLPRIDYSPTNSGIAHPPPALVVAGALLVVIGIGLVAWHWLRPTRWTWAAVLGVATLAPVSNLVLHTGVILADRTLYSPSIASCIVIGGAVVAARALTPMLSGAIACTLMAIGSVDTFRTVSVWRDNASVFSAMRERAPTSYRGYYLLGMAEARLAHAPSPSAQQDYVAAIARFDGDPGLLYDAAVNALQLGDTADAESWLATAIARSPEQRRSRTELILLHLRQHDPAPARSLLEAGLAREPDQRLWRKLLDSLARQPDRPT